MSLELIPKVMRINTKNRNIRNMIGNCCFNGRLKLTPLQKADQKDQVSYVSANQGSSSV